MILFHSTSREHRQSILNAGLLTSFDQTGFDAIFLTNKPSNDNSDVWQVDCSNIEIEEDLTTMQDENECGKWFMVHQNISPCNLTLLNSLTL
jgi:hypothetical protein